MNEMKKVIDKRRIKKEKLSKRQRNKERKGHAVS